MEWKKRKGMKYKWKSLVACFVVIVTCAFMGENKGYAQEESEFSLTFPEGKDEKYFETQTESIIQYNELLSNLTLENKSVIWSRGVTKYGGMY